MREEDRHEKHSSSESLMTSVLSRGGESKVVESTHLRVSETLSPEMEEPDHTIQCAQHLHSKIRHSKVDWVWQKTLFLFYPMYRDGLIPIMAAGFMREPGREEVGRKKRTNCSFSPSESQEVKNFLVGKELFLIPPPILYFFRFSNFILATQKTFRNLTWLVKSCWRNHLFWY